MQRGQAELFPRRATVAGKAMLVCFNREIAYDFYQIVVGLRPEWAEKKICPDGVKLSDKEKKELKPIEKIKLIMTRNKDDESTLYEVLGQMFHNFNSSGFCPRPSTSIKKSTALWGWSFPNA